MENTTVYQRIISEIKDGKSQYYFYVPSSSKFASAGVAYVYDLVKTLIENGFDAKILHEKEYLKPTWMGKEYENLPHCGFETIKASDFLFLPEVYVQAFFDDMEKNAIKLPCDVVVISQVYDLIYHSLKLGYDWSSFRHRNGVSLWNVITTSENQKKYIEESMRGLNIHVINPFIHQSFKKSDKPQKPFIMVMSRDKNEGEALVKEFWNAFPHYRWIPFKLVNNLDRDVFAKDVAECCLAVWIDQRSSFGTFPLECMKCGVPVVGVIPSMIPEWMYKTVDTENGERLVIADNGFWVSSKLDILNTLRQLLDMWLSQTLDEQIYNEMNSYYEKYSKENNLSQVLEVFKNIKDNRIQYLEKVEERENHNKNIKNINDAR